MHFDEHDNLDHNKILENKRVPKGKKARKYTDKMFFNIIGYDKANLKFSSFVNRSMMQLKEKRDIVKT